MSTNTSLATNSDGSFNNGSSQTGYNGAPTAQNITSGRLPPGVLPGGVSANANMGGVSPNNARWQSKFGGVIKAENDWRIRISLQPSLAKYFYSDPSNLLLNKLQATSGVIFPYTPQIQVTHTARYNPTLLTHSNYASHFYEGSEVQSININADFTVQNWDEGQYLLAVIHFFRSVTKMFYGRDPLAGAPPPLVFLNGYGTAYFPNVSCVVTQFTHTMPADSDYLEVPIGVQNGSVAGNAINLTSIPTIRLPVASQINVNLQPVYSRTNVVQNFSLQSFARGQFVSQVKGTGALTGGFI
jgi:hypothetical protein